MDHAGLEVEISMLELSAETSSEEQGNLPFCHVIMGLSNRQIARLQSLCVWL